jgi:hydrogenase nickel incorporation protein HypA/HybF
MIEMASKEAARRGDARVIALHLKLGPLSGVVKEALTFSYDVACEGTALEGSRLIIEDVPVMIHCSGCDKNQVIETIQSVRCPECGDLSAAIIQGRELELVALELDQIEELVT